jgi:hypothetical protein
VRAMRGWFRLLAAFGVLALVAAACSSGNEDNAAPAGASATGATGATGQMEMQPGAENMHVDFVSPERGFVLTGNTLKFEVKTSGYSDSCDTAGKPVAGGEGHYHILLDGSLINMFCTAKGSVSMQNVAPGEHMLEAVPAQNDHAEVHDNAVELPFMYEPSNPLPEITEPVTGTPTIQILEPQDGATLSGDFDVMVRITDYEDACSLLGKPDVPGYGHWHVNIDSMTGPMMGMGTMLGMACTNTFHGSTVGLDAGSTHTLFALLTDDGHAPIDVFDQIQFTVGS